MIVVADTSPLNYLIQLGHVRLLPLFYGKILVPLAVHDELLNEAAPEAVRAWAKDPPAWLQLISPSTVPAQMLATLDAGEAQAIALAEELHADWLLIDEADGREEASRRGLRVVGTLGILLDAHRSGLINFPIEAERLQRAGFYVSDDLIKRLSDLV